MVIKPIQRNSKNQKDSTWVDECIKYYRTEAKPIVDETKAVSRYNVALGVLNESEYLYVTNPKNSSRQELQGYPSKMRNIPIGPPIFAVLMGEKSKRFIDYQVVAFNSDIENLKIAKETELVLTNLQNDFYNQLNKEQNNVIRTPEQIRKEVDGIIDDIAIMGQEAVDYMRFFNDLDRKFKELFFDALCQNCFVSARYVKNDEVIFEVIDPREISLVAGRNMSFLEDAECQIRKTRMSITEMYDAFSEVEGFEKIKKELDSEFEGTVNEPVSPRRISGYSDIDVNFSNYYNRAAAGVLFENLNLTRRGRDFENSEYYDVEHVIWDTYVKIGIKEVIDPFNGITEEEVSEEYVPEEGEEVRWTWKKVPYEAYYINNEYSVGGRFVPTVQSEYNGTNMSKKIYNGRILDGISISDIVLPYQVKHNIYNYYIEKLVGKHRGDIVILPISIMPDGNNEHGIDWETSLYYADADGIMIVDDSDKDKLQGLQYMKILNSQLDNTLRQIKELATENKMELEEILGINRFRKGQNNSSDGKYVSQQAEYRGSMMSEHLFTQVDESHQKDLSRMLDLSQIAWSDGKKEHYISSQFRRAFLDINPERYSFAKFGVGINNNSRATEKLNLMRQYTQAISQDANVPKNVIPRIIDADNMATLVREMDKLTADFEAKQQNATDAERQHELELQRMKIDEIQKQLDLQYYKVDSDNRTKVEVAMISKEGGALPTGTEMNDPLEALRKQNIELSKQRLEEAKIRMQRELALIKERTEKYKADKSYQVAKENKNPKN